MDVNLPIYIEHANTLEDMGKRLAVISEEFAEQNCIIGTVSHAIDDKDPEGRVTYVVVGRSAVL